MGKQLRWTTSLRFSILIFLSFMLEYFSLFVIELLILHRDIFHYTKRQQSIHHLIMLFLWTAYLVLLLWYSRRKYAFPNKEKTAEIHLQDWLVVCFCLAVCKFITWIDWHTLKVIGEAQGKNVVQYIAQYAYYMLEIEIVLLIILYGQKAFELLLKKDCAIPFGGMVLAMTWGIFHFVSRGAGIEVWNGFSCMIFSILSGVMYVRLKKNLLYSYLFIAVGYLL